MVGHLGTVGPDGYPYVVPLFFVYHGGEVYFHSAPEGHKLLNIATNSRVCFQVSEWRGILDQRGSACPTGALYRSVILFGRAREVQDEREKLEILQLLSAKYGVARPVDPGGWPDARWSQWQSN